MRLEDLYKVLSDDIVVVVEENTPNGIVVIHSGFLKDCDCDYMTYDVNKISHNGDRLIIEVF